MTVSSAQCVKTDCRHILSILLYFNGHYLLQAEVSLDILLYLQYIYILRAVDCYIFYILPFVRVHNTLRSCQSFCAGGNVTVTGSSPNISKFLQRFWRKGHICIICWNVLELPFHIGLMLTIVVYLLLMFNTKYINNMMSLLTLYFVWFIGWYFIFVYFWRWLVGRGHLA